MIKRYYIAALLIFSCSSALAAGDVRGHCGNKEQIVFSCHVGKKVLSLCMSKPDAGESGYMQYRFGPLNRPELVFPKALESATKNFFLSSAGYSAGGEARVRFSIGTYDYILYSKVTSAPPDASGIREKFSSAGLVILNSKKPIGDLQCMEKNTDFNFPDGYLKEENFNYDVDTP